MQNKVKEIRVKLDGLSELCKQFAPSREISLAITKMQDSKMWLGKLLKEIGVENPYPESKNHANEKIEPTADTGKLEFPKPVPGDGEYSHIQKVKWIRHNLEEVEVFLKSMVILNNHWGNHASVKSIEYCIESGMWLGMELGRINNLK